MHKFKNFIPNIILLMMVCKTMQAQLGFCNGNSGAPIFTEDFGTGTTNTTLPAGTTTYSFLNGIPNDGEYTVTNTLSGNTFEWHPISDHTSGDTNGKMLVINADDNMAGEFFRTTVTGLCENTTYEFSAWMVNVLIAGGYCSTQPGGEKPINVRFEIWDSTDSNLLASGSTGNITATPSPNWQEYGLVFQTLGGQNDVILKMLNNGTGGCGNDLAIDDIEFKSCGDTVSISDSNNTTTSNLCSTQIPLVDTLTALPDFVVFGSHFYQWQESIDGINWNDIVGETNQTLSISTNTTTYYRTKIAEVAINLGNPLCVIFSDEYLVNINQLPAMPSIECWETATINDTTCTWEVTGTQPSPPTLECWETMTFNTTTCSWEVSGSQPPMPSLECWETATFNTATCSWELSGSQPQEPLIECWEIATFNADTCSWELSGLQPEEPITSCNEVAVFNDLSCSWEINEILIEPVEENLFFCGTETIQLSADIDNAAYLWGTGETSKDIIVNQVGVYSVEIEDNLGCIFRKIITVKNYDLPIIENVVSNGTSIKVNTVNSGDYEYSIDGVGYQLSNIFNGVEGDYYTIYARSIYGCPPDQIQYLHFVIPKVMTPNGDSYNDTFSLKGIESYQSSEVYIFNRYGKLLKSSKNRSFAWDGTFNNILLPNDDYWYLIKIEGREFRGHFALKR